VADFQADIRQFKTVAQFAAYLSALPKPNWTLGKIRHGPIGSCVHNTYIPTEPQWRGRPTMLAMQASYAAKGWSSGPHVYLAQHSPNPEHNGIWQMTPPTMPGTHAGACNVQRFGVEVVGDFDKRHWTALQRQLLLETLEALHIWANLQADIVGHRDCMPGRTCPGDAAYADLPKLRDDLAIALAFRRAPVKRHRVLGVPVYQRQEGTGPVAGYLREGEIVEIDAAYANGMGHLKSGLGFVDLDSLERVRE
jgi:hypothetical protein